MGGPGSGHWYRWTKKALTDESRQLDVNRWRRDGLLRPMASFSWSWWRADNASTPSSTVGVRVLRDAVRLEYTLTRSGEDVSYAVGFTWTPYLYGGRRP